MAVAGVPRTIRLTLAYDGTGFHGWAKQPGHRTVEGELVRVLEPILGHTPRLSVAGRTDAGVHAAGQVASFVPARPADPKRIQRVLNDVLAPEIMVASSSFAPAGFDARFSATARCYRYRVNTSEWPDPFTARFVWHRAGRLDVPRMRSAAALLVGEHDFLSFCRPPKDGGSTVRRLERLTVAMDGELIALGVRADAFLHQMVRSLVGTLVRVGEGKIEPSAMTRILAAGDRAAAGPVAPPGGLTLERIVCGPRSVHSTEPRGGRALTSRPSRR